MTGQGGPVGPFGELFSDGVPSGVVVLTGDDTRDHQWALPVDDADFERLALDTFEPLAESWSPIEMEILREVDGTPLAHADVPWLGHHTLVMREAAAEVIAPLVDGQAELLALTSAEGPLWLLHITERRDALDEGASDIVWFPSSDRILTIRSHVFRPERLRGARCFKIPQCPRGYAYFSEELASRIREAGLAGFATETVWTAPPR